MIPTSLRTGFAADDEEGNHEAADQVLHTVAALMRVFMKESLLVAGRYTHAHGRKEVTGEDMRRSLMYCARLFFQQEDVDERVRREVEEMEDEESEEESEGEDEEESEGEDEESGDEEQEKRSNPEDEEEDAYGSASHDDLPSPSDLQLAKHVDAIVASWSLWNPEDPVHQLIKRAIDQTPV